MSPADFEDLLTFACDTYGIDRRLISYLARESTMHVAIRRPVSHEVSDGFHAALSKGMSAGLDLVLEADIVPAQLGLDHLYLAAGHQVAGYPKLVSETGFARVGVIQPPSATAHTVKLRAESGAIFDVMFWREGPRGIPCLIRCENRAREPGHGTGVGGDGDHTRTVFEGYIGTDLIYELKHMRPGWELKRVEFVMP